MADQLNFEFEAQLDNTLQHNLLANAATTTLDQRGDLVTVPPQEIIGQQPGNYKKNYKKTVCTYWLRGMCMKGDQCGFLHQYDVEKMPICRNLLKFGECKELDCPYKHNTEEIKECNMYKLGFCIYGPSCRYKHKPAPGPPPKVETVEAAKPKDYRDINTVVNWANPGVIGAREREALESMGMGASLRRTGTAGGARRKYGWEGSGGGVGEGGGFGLQQEGQHHGYKRARVDSSEQQQQQQQSHEQGVGGNVGQQGGGEQTGMHLGHHMPGIMAGHQGMPSLMGHNMHQPGIGGEGGDLGMPPLMPPGMPGMSGPMHPGMHMPPWMMGLPMPGMQ